MKQCLFGFLLVSRALYNRDTPLFLLRDGAFFRQLRGIFLAVSFLREGKKRDQCGGWQSADCLGSGCGTPRVPDPSQLLVIVTARV